MTAHAEPSRRSRRIGLHLFRAAMFAGILGLMHLQHAERRAQQLNTAAAEIPLDSVRALFPGATALRAPGLGGQEVTDANGQVLGTVAQTSPAGDRIVGFSGPTNLLVAFDNDGRPVGMRVLSSGDTAEHVEQVEKEVRFWEALEQYSREQLAGFPRVDAVSGATLTSMAIQESLALRFGGEPPPSRFPQPLSLAEAQTLFPDAVTIRPHPLPARWAVLDSEGVSLGSVLRTTPAADAMIGFQGPTETFLGLDPQDRVRGIAIGESFDNEPYVSYVREDKYFRSRFHDVTLEELSTMDLRERGIEGVSGATMTSIAVADGIVAAAQSDQQARETFARREARERSILRDWELRDWGTGLVVLAGIALGLSPLRARRGLRVAFQLLLIVYLGLINGDMVSQAMIVGWAQHGVPWRLAGGLILLTAAAFLLPITTRRNIYCTHLCPHGVAQQLLIRRVPWQPHLSPAWMRALKLVPGLLLLWCVVVAMAGLGVSLVAIEPFDAYVFRIAGWATLTVAIIGLIASLFVPMAYCRFGCPTGALLNYLRFNARSDRWGPRDSFCLGLVAVALLLFWLQ